MAEFNVTTRNLKPNKSGYYSVFISVVHNKKTRYIKTQLLVNQSGIKTVVNRRGNKNYEIKDKHVLKKCFNLIDLYVLKCNKMDISNMDCQELIHAILHDSDGKISFTAYCSSYIDKMRADNRGRSADNYVLALRNLQKYLDKEEIYFSELTTKIIKNWILSLAKTHRAKNMYPTYVKKMFNEGVDYHNDYDRDIIKISNDPFRGVKIPREDVPTNKRNIDKDVLMKIFNMDVAEHTYFGKELRISRERLAIDVSKIIFCLAGINTADLYVLEKSNYKDGKLKYCRKKTRDRRVDNAYTEIEVPDDIKPLFVKYAGKKRLFNFSERYCSSTEFVRNVDKGLSIACTRNGIEKVTSYTFRHTWATMARNVYGASMDDVAIALVHTSNHKVTDRYVDKDYSIIDKINRFVIDYVFGKAKKTRKKKDKAA